MGKAKPESVADTLKRMLMGNTSTSSSDNTQTTSSSSSGNIQIDPTPPEPPPPPRSNTQPCTKHQVDGFEAFKELLPSLPARKVFMYFTASRNADGTAWCKDSAKAAPFIDEFAENLSNEYTFVHCTVGDKDVWNDVTNPFRHFTNFKLQALPTLMSSLFSNRLKKEQCADREILKKFQKTVQLAQRNADRKYKKKEQKIFDQKMLQQQQKEEEREAVELVRSHTDWWKADEKRLTALRKAERCLKRIARRTDKPKDWAEYRNVKKIYHDLTQAAKKKDRLEAKHAKWRKEKAEEISANYMPLGWQEGQCSSTDPSSNYWHQQEAQSSSTYPSQRFIQDQSWSDVLCHPAGNESNIPSGYCNLEPVQSFVPPRWQQPLPEPDRTIHSTDSGVLEHGRMASNCAQTRTSARRSRFDQVGSLMSLFPGYGPSAVPPVPQPVPPPATVRIPTAGAPLGYSTTAVQKRGLLPVPGDVAHKKQRFEEGDSAAECSVDYRSLQGNTVDGQQGVMFDPSVYIDNAAFDYPVPATVNVEGAGGASSKLDAVHREQSIHNRIRSLQKSRKQTEETNTTSKAVKFKIKSAKTEEEKRKEEVLAKVKAAQTEHRIEAVKFKIKAAQEEQRIKSGSQELNSSSSTAVALQRELLECARRQQELLFAKPQRIHQEQDTDSLVALQLQLLTGSSGSKHSDSPSNHHRVVEPTEDLIALMKLLSQSSGNSRLDLISNPPIHQQSVMPPAGIPPEQGAIFDSTVYNGVCNYPVPSSLGGTGGTVGFHQMEPVGTSLQTQLPAETSGRRKRALIAQPPLHPAEWGSIRCALQKKILADSSGSRQQDLVSDPPFHQGCVEPADGLVALQNKLLAASSRNKLRDLVTESSPFQPKVLEPADSLLALQNKLFADLQAKKKT